MRNDNKFVGDLTSSKQEIQRRITAKKWRGSNTASMMITNQQ
jgi:hypothetical protein